MLVKQVLHLLKMEEVFWGGENFVALGASPSCNRNTAK